MAKKKSDKPILHNIRILDFTWVLAGPYATRLLADYGAEVIKVQPLLPTEGEDAFERGYYNTWNRNKLGVTLNLNKPEGVELAKKLVKVCDAVIENFTPRVMANWGLDFANLKKVKPDIIMVSMSAMGQQSATSHYTGFAPTVHALSGLTGKMAIDRQPVGPGFSYADHIAGLYAAMSLLAALEGRMKSGEGRHIDLSETDLLAGLLPEKESLKAPEGIYPCKGDNRWLAITVDSEEGWEGMKKALGNPAWAEDAGYKTIENRIAQREELDRQIIAWTRLHTAEELMGILRRHGVASGIVQDADALAKDQQLKARGFFVGGGATPFIDAPPVKMRGIRVESQTPAPPPGRDNAYVYGKLLGLSKKEIGTLKKNGVIFEI
jgi:benzylsuccinate CoA-transferase BbsF subunit